MSIQVEEKVFEKVKFAVDPLEKGIYENCSFINCDFSTVNLSGQTFIHCLFDGCNLCQVRIGNLSLNNVTFKNCKQLGWDFSQCNELLFSAAFESCNLNYSQFTKMTVKGIRFVDCSLQEVDFGQANLTGAIFANCDLTRAIFLKTNLEKSDFRTSYNYAFDPEQNRIKKAKFCVPEVLGLLSKFDIEIEG